MKHHSSTFTLLSLAYSVAWIAIASAIVYYVHKAGYSLWIGAIAAYGFFILANGSIAYRYRAKQLKLEGKAPQPYLNFLVAPNGLPKLKGEAPREAHALAGIIAALAGAFFVFCGIAPAFDAEWSRNSHPVVLVIVCLVPTGIGIAFLYIAWRCLASGKRPTNVA